MFSLSHVPLCSALSSTETLLATLFQILAASIAVLFINIHGFGLFTVTKHNPIITHLFCDNVKASLLWLKNQTSVISCWVQPALPLSAHHGTDRLLHRGAEKPAPLQRSTFPSSITRTISSSLSQSAGTTQTTIGRTPTTAKLSRSPRPLIGLSSEAEGPSSLPSRWRSCEECLIRSPSLHRRLVL